MDWALTGALIGLIIAFCYLLDWLVSKKEEDKQKITIIKWWSQLDDFSYSEAIHKSNVFCNEIFDRIYGKEHLSRRCIKASFCVSITSVLILTTYILTAFPEMVPVSAKKTPLIFYAEMLTMTVYVNCWIDYLSLIETRIILRLASRLKPLMLPMLLLVDVLLSAIIFLSNFLLLVIASFSRLGQVMLPLRTYFEISQGIMTWKNVSTNLSIYFYSTFSTSVLFYIYCLSTLFFKFIKLSKTRIMVVLEKLEDSEHPFKAFGGFLAAVVVFVKAVVEIIQHIFQA